MNAYTTPGQARIRQRDLANILRTDVYLAPASLEGLERQRGGQAAAEVNWLVRQHGARPPAAASLVSTLRQMIGAALVRVGQRLAAAPRPDAAGERAAAGTLGVTTGGQ